MQKEKNSPNKLGSTDKKTSKIHDIKGIEAFAKKTTAEEFDNLRINIDKIDMADKGKLATPKGLAQMVGLGAMMKALDPLGLGSARSKSARSSQRSLPGVANLDSDSSVNGLNVHSTPDSTPLLKKKKNGSSSSEK